MTKSMKALHQTLSGMKAEDVASARREVQAELERDTTPSNVEDASADDLRKAGAIASDFMAGMEKMTTVLMLLVLKFGRAATAMKVVLALMLLGNIFFVIALVSVYNVNRQLHSIIESQERIVEKQVKQERALQAAEDRAKEAEARALAAEEAAPRVVVDEETGRPKLVIPGGTSDPPEEGPAPSHRSPSAKPAPKQTSKGVEFPLDF